MRKKGSLVFFGTLVGVLFLIKESISGVFAACPTYVPSILCTESNNGVNGTNNLIGNIIVFVIAAAGVIVLVYIIWAGFKYMSSGGDASKKGDAQKQIIAAVIGLIIIVFSYFIVNIIFGLLGLGSPTSPELPCNINNQNINGTTGNCLGASGTPVPSS